jgi:VWFA-related protein
VRRFVCGILFAAAFGELDAQSFRERVEVQLVRVELLATDSQGRPIEGLREAEVHVRVDGRPVALESFEPPSSPLPDLPAPMPELPRGQGRILAAPVAKLQQAGAAPSRSYLAILADETSSEQSNRQATYAQLFEFLKDPSPPGLTVELLRFDGKLRVVCPWTSDPELLRKGAAALQKTRATPRVGPPGSIASVPEGAPNRPDFDAREANIHAASSLTALFDALREFPEAPGRKSLFVITDGAPFLAPSEIARDLIATSASDASNQGGADALRRAQLETDRDTALLLDGLAWDRTRSASLLIDITRLALLRGIEIHPVRSAPHDLAGLVRTDRGSSERARAGMGRSLDARSQRVAAAPPTTDIGAGQGMEEIARTSGGEAVLSRRFFNESLRRETEKRPYLLSFRDPFAGDHRFHAITISTGRPGVELRYRRGYRILDALEALVEASANRLHVPADENPLAVRLAMDVLRQEEGQVVTEVRIAYPAPPEAGGTARAAANLQVIAICGVRDQPMSAPIDFSGTAEPVRFGEATWLVRTARVRVKPGAYRWSFAIRDDQTGITSYLTFDRSLP